MITLALEIIPYPVQGVSTGTMIIKYFPISFIISVIIAATLISSNPKKEEETTSPKGKEIEYIETIEIRGIELNFVALGMITMVTLVILMNIFIGVPYKQGGIEKDNLEHIEITSLDVSQINMKYHNIENFDKVTITTENGELISTKTVNNGELKGSLPYDQNLKNIRIVVLKNGKIIEEQTLRMNIRTDYINIIDGIKILL